ncbi:hypothetical protein Pcinc_015613 [Petrolisthes cinctipes]|uniref:Solute carrier organic anion transporter family member n=1 Tax=Petrolisthes cinctipes TaxID=88211 RepID=A0AAE1KPJ5_PETCI|nr:hypothetical protein Pcinc_015613 [Petrolisthes cinctipes]
MIPRVSKDEEEAEEEEEGEKVKVTKAEMQLMFTPKEIEDTRCGIGSCSPGWLQWFATKEVYMLVYSLVGVTQGMFFTYSVSVISTIEKRFKLTSKETGLLLTGNDISQVLLAIFLSYYATFGHRPRWLGVGALLTAASCLTAALPHLIYGPGRDALEAVRVATIPTNSTSSLLLNNTGLHSNEELCHNKPDDHCQEERGYDYLGSIILLFLSQLLVGVAISIMFSIGVTFLDDNISKKTYPIYYTLTLLVRIMGPVMGFIVGGKCLSIWIDPSVSPNINKEDPRWLGAWWLGLVFIAAGLSVTALPLFLFPRKLPATLRREARRYKRKALKTGERQEQVVEEVRRHRHARRPNIKNLGAALKRLFANKVWAGNLFSSTVTLLALSGYWNFKPKYLENQFRKSAAEANYYTGMASLVVSVVGAVISGVIMRWARPGPKLVTGYNIFVTFVSCFGFLSLMFVGCPKLDVIGPMNGSVGPACSGECGCSERYNPVCAQDNTTLFFSPCYAGCTKDHIASKPIEYSGCRCISDSGTIHLDNTTIPPQEEWGRAFRGYCPEPCNGFFYYFLIQIITKTIVSTSRIGSSIVLLRAVSDEDKGVSLGTITVFISLFGFIPAPIIMGAIIDSTCLVWDHSCGKKGNCWLYDSDQFRTVLHLVPTILIFISMFGEFVVYRNCDSLDLYGLKEDMGLTKKMKEVEAVDEKDDAEEERKEEEKPLKSDPDRTTIV